MPSPVTAKGVWGNTDSSPGGVWGEAPGAFLTFTFILHDF